MQGKKAIVLGRSKIVVSLEKDFALRRFDLSVFDIKEILIRFRSVGCSNVQSAHMESRYSHSVSFKNKKPA